MRRGPLNAVVVFGFSLGAGWTGMAPSVQAAEPTKAAAIGDKVANGSSLRDLRGNRRPLHDFKGYSALVLAFVGADCPISNLYLPRLIEIEKKYRSREVQFL